MPPSKPINDIALPQINRISASYDVATALRNAIVDGVMPAGEPLKQDEIAARFQVSKIPVREALKRLEAEGLVTFVQNCGAVVAIMSTEEIGEYLDIRCVLEAKAAELSAPHVTQGTLELAQRYLDTFKEEDSPRERANLNLVLPFDPVPRRQPSDPDGRAAHAL